MFLGGINEKDISINGLPILFRRRTNESILRSHGVQAMPICHHHDERCDQHLIIAITPTMEN